MKFKVGDKVKVINCDISGTNCRNLNRISTITDIMDRADYPYKLKGIGETFREGELELVERQFTKSDLKDGDIVTYRNGQKKIVFENKLYGHDHFVSLEYYTKNLEDVDGVEGYDIIKVERPAKYETVFERKEEILDETEKRYLASVIKPFRKRVKSIAKQYYKENEYIILFLKGSPNTMLPFFEEGTMYKGMESDREYSLKELGL